MTCAAPLVINILAGIGALSCVSMFVGFVLLPKLFSGERRPRP